MNENQHYVSQVLLRRFAIAGHVQSFDVRRAEWIRKSPKRVFSSIGYNQLLLHGQLDNSLEAAFSKVETLLPKTFEALDLAASCASSDLLTTTYENLCWYCAFLKGVSPFAKAAASFSLVAQINKDLEDGHGKTLREVLQLPDAAIDTCLEQYSRGYRAIIDSKDFLQVAYRIQFRQNYAINYSLFRNCTKLKICKTAMEMPIADVALIELPDKLHRCNLYCLPVGPRRLLIGVLKWGDLVSSPQTQVRGLELTREESEYWLDVICLAAVRELVASNIIPNVPAIRERALAKGIRFNKIVNPDSTITAGVSDFTEIFGVRFVPLETYVEFAHSFVQPPDDVRVSA